MGADIQRANAIVGAGVNGGAGAGAGAGAKVDGADVGARAGAERPKVPKMTVIQDEEG